MQKILPAICIMVMTFTSCQKTTEQSATYIENNKSVTWSKTYGGNEYEFANAIVQLPGGEYAVAGATRSSNGDIPGSRAGFDAWLIKMDQHGNKLLSTTFGEHDDDYATGLVSTPDGYIITGFTFISNRHYAWAIKADASGQQVWKKSLTESTDAKPAAIIPASDGGYLISGYSSVSGNRDGWLVKIDGNGNRLWTKSFGGTNEDQFTSVTKVSGGGYVLTGFSNSGNVDLGENKGSYDGWIVKVDQGGNKIWNSSFGGSDEDYLKSVVASADGGYLAVGYTKSGNGDLPKNRGGFDEWLIKIDANGQKQWIKTYGGANEEYITNVVGTPDGGYMTIGYTNSTTGDVFRINNDFGGWLLKLDANGNKTAASTYGTDRYDDFTNALIPTQDGGYMITGYSFVEGRGYDGWMVKIDEMK
jgi:hypothetical protein